MTDEYVEETPIEEAPVEAPEVTERNWEAEAREDGWCPQEEWKGKPDQWVDAETFVKRGEEIRPILQAKLRRLQEDNEKKDREMADRLSRMERVYEEATKKQLQQQREELLKARREAIERGDGEAFEKAESEIQMLERSKSEPPENIAFKQRNPWFGKDPEMTQYANIIAPGLYEQMAAQGADRAAYLNALEQQVKAHFKDKFESKPARNVVEAPKQAPKTKGNGWDKLPPEAKKAGEDFIRRNIFADKEAYAKSYWNQ